MLLALIFGNKA